MVVMVVMMVIVNGSDGDGSENVSSGSGDVM